MAFRHFAVAGCFSVLGLVSSASAAFIGGFEAPTYASGPVHLQDGWLVSGGTVEGQAASRVRTAAEISSELTGAGLNGASPVHSGQQALVHSGFGSGVSAVLQIPELNATPNVVVSASARPLLPGPTSGESTIGFNNGNTFIMMESVAGVNGRAAGVRFGFTNSVRTIDYFTRDAQNAPVWVSTPVPWDGDSWHDVRFEMNFDDKTYDFYVDQNKINAAPILFPHASTTDFHRIHVYRGTSQAGMIVDDILAVPEPSSAMLTLCAAATLRLASALSNASWLVARWASRPRWRASCLSASVSWARRSSICAFRLSSWAWLAATRVS